MLSDKLVTDCSAFLNNVAYDGNNLITNNRFHKSTISIAIRR